MPDIKTQQLVGIRDSTYNFTDYIMNVTDIALSEYEKMEQRDEVIKAGIQYLSGSIINAIGEYHNDDVTIRVALEHWKENLVEDFQIILEQMIKNVLVFGYAPAEIVWEIKNKKANIKKITILDPLSCVFKFVGDKINIEYITSKGVKILIPPEKTLILKRGAGLYGESILRSAYSYFQTKLQLKKDSVIAMRKFGIPTILAKTAEPESAMTALSQWFNNVGIAIPLNTDVTLLQTGGDMSTSYINMIKFCNESMLTGLFVPNLLVTNNNTGSYALSSNQYQLFRMNIMSLAEVLSKQILDQLLVRTIEYNFGAVENYGEFAIINESDITEKKMLAEMFEILIRSGIVDPSETYLRESLKIPDSDVEPVGGDIDDEPKGTGVDVSTGGSADTSTVEKGISESNT